ncbi:hypothetical protein Syun_023819 [Stephania yunnanensis]|uniref:LOB domain-containing protein n=1 Tax=Stephania yunnanensis TaxID=152371 RepID=A0AAP0FI59_9MAGN
MTVKGGTSQACAACKYQRRKCSADCPLAPYFPPDQSKLFHTVHRLFGVSNVLKVLKHVKEDKRHTAMHSIIHHARVRHDSPVHGYCAVIRALEHRIAQALFELQLVRAQIALAQQQQQISGGGGGGLWVHGQGQGQGQGGGGCYDDVDEGMMSSVVVDPTELVLGVDKAMDGCDYVDEMHQFFQAVDEEERHSSSAGYVGKREFMNLALIHLQKMEMRQLMRHSRQRIMN